MTNPATLDGIRRVLVLAHTRRAEARDVARAFVKELSGHGIVVRLLRSEADELELDPAGYIPEVELTDTETEAQRTPSVFNPTYGADAAPAATKGKKKPFILDPLLDERPSR